MLLEKKIIYIVGEFPSLTEHFIANEIEGLLERGLPVEVLSIARPANARALLTNSEPTLEKISYFNYFSLLNFMAGLYCITRYLKPFIKVHAEILQLLFTKPNVALRKIKHLIISTHFIYKLRKSKHIHLHAHFATLPCTVAFMMSFILGCPYSVSAHASDIYAANPELKRNLDGARFVITCTKSNLQHLEKLTGKNNIYCIYHGINLAAWPFVQRKGIVSGEPVKLLCIGRLVEKKGWPMVLKTIKILKETRHVHCTIIGDGPLRKKLEQDIEQLGILNEVTLLGGKPQSELLFYYHTQHIFLLPCQVAGNGDRDGLPNVLPEALATGIPVISTTVSAIPELIINGETGLLVDAGDEQAMVSAVNSLIEDSLLYRSVSKKGKETVNTYFDMEQGTGRVYTLFKEFA